MSRQAPLLLGALAAPLLLLAAAPAPGAALRTLRGAGAGADPTAPLVGLLALVAWALAAWLLVTLAVTAGAHLPGRVGRLARATARRVAPAAVRRAVEVALGLGVAVGVAAPAAAGGPAPPPPVASLDWPGATPRQEPAPDPLPTAMAPASAPARILSRPDGRVPPVTVGPRSAPPVVVVQPGDSLWRLAARDLASRGAPTSDRAVAQAWPAWWAANREAVGDDPDLIQPGTRLSPPAPGSAPAGPAPS